MNLQNNDVQQVLSLKNGATAVLLPSNHTQTVSLGILVGAGAITETPSTLGYSHFIEHMIFKGTDRFHYEQINMFFEKMGGYINAYTNRYFTVYYVQLLKEFANDALKMLLHMITESSFKEEEINKERAVILEEMISYQDTPDDFTVEQFYARVFDQSYMGCPIIGTKESLDKATRESLLQYYKEHYVPSNMVISIAGNIDPQELLTTIDLHDFKNVGDKKIAFPSLPVRFHTGQWQDKKDIEQTHIAIGFPIDPYKKGEEAIYRTFNMLLGELTSSRLYLSVREKMALCYHIDSQLVQDPSQGLIFIYGSTKDSQSQQLADAIIKEIKNLSTNPFTYDELEMAKNQLKTKWIFKKETISSLMIKNAVDIYFNRKTKEEEFIEQIDMINLEKLNELSAKIIKNLEHASLFALTPNSYKKIIKINP